MTEPTRVIVTGSVTARDVAIAEVESLCLAHVRRSRLEPGCLLHSVHRDVENEARFVFLEHWRSRADLDRHFAVPESGGFITALRDLCITLDPIEIYEVTDSA